jgi:lipid-A-disaccharide synthase
MRYYIIAGEASGDLHGANLLKHLKLQDAKAVFQGWGGNRMQAEGMQLQKHYSELAFMGFWEVVKNLNTILKNFSIVKKDILNFKPDVVILIDYPGFNLRLAKWLKAHKIKVFYYISPQLWAWKENRVEQVRKYVDRMFCIIPFEKEFYAKHGIEVDFVGHPLLDAIEQNPTKNSFFQQEGLNENLPVVALLPGSREQEVKRMLPLMTKMATHFQDIQFVVAGLDYLGHDFYKKYLTKQSNISVVMNSTYRLLSVAKAALVTSGTATLETALFNVPQVVCYKGGLLSYIIGKWLIKVPYISLVNLICGRQVVVELIQQDFNENTLAKNLKQLFNENYRNEVLSSYTELKNILGGAGASEKTAKLIWMYLNKTADNKN